MRLDERSLLCVSGAGTESASRAASLLIERGARGLLSWGCAAGLAPALEPGDLCLPNAILDVRGQSFAVSTAWHARARWALATGFTLRTGPMLTVERLVASAEEKSTLADTHSAIAVDMESAAVAAVAHERRVLFLAIRAVADPADLPLPHAVARATSAQGIVRLPQLIGYALLHPSELSGLVRIARCFRAALRTLSAVAHRMGSGFLLNAGTCAR